MLLLLTPGAAHAGQSVGIFNEGTAVADTGGNTANGDFATVGTTGDASAIGVDADTFVDQIAEGGDAGQSVDIVNDGVAIAETGENTAGATETSSTDGELSEGVITDAVVVTGDAGAIGVDAETSVVQVGEADQSIVAFNEGIADADTGGNTANGDFATVVTGGAGAIGVDADTFVDQIAEGGDAGQSVDIVNDGVAIAETGGNSTGASDDDPSDDDSDDDSSDSSVTGAVIVTGDATAIGVNALIFVLQLNLGDHATQSVAIFNEGRVVAETGGKSTSAGRGGAATIITGHASVVGIHTETSVSQLRVAVLSRLMAAFG